MSFIDLKHIPCPAGDNCTAFLCLFKHDKDRDVSAPPDTTADSKRSRPVRDDDQGEPQKRLKIQNEIDSSSSIPSVPIDSVSSLNRPISPPSLTLKRQAQRPAVASSKESPSPPKLTAVTRNTPKTTGTTRSSTPKPSSSSSTPTPSSSSPQTHQPKAGTASTPPAPAQSRKPESLNPRLLKSAPVGHDTRYRLLKMLYQEFARLNNELRKSAKDEDKKLLLSEQELTWRALDEEEKIAIEKGPIYPNVVKNRIMQYKRMTLAQWRDERVTERKRSSHRSRSEKKAAGAPKNTETGLNSKQEVKIVRTLLTPVDDLSAHGYVSSIPTDEEVEKARQGIKASHGWEKCDRCEQRFQVFPGRREEDGVLASGGSCYYHHGKTYYPERQPGDRSQQQKRYRCCGQAVGDSAGCVTAPHHVFKATDAKRLATTLNFAKTPANPHVSPDRAVCFDCEMCYTVNGMELVRLTATSWRGKVLLDVLVQPMGEILDLNSRYSGVWPEDMASAEPWTRGSSPRPSSPAKGGDSDSESDSSAPPKKQLKIVPSPEVARELLFSLISPDTPLIGHGIDNDLNAVRIIHPTIVDTVLLYPHKHGLPYRYGLKMLMEQHLNKKIQVEVDGDNRGHDSAEDAKAAGELVRLRVMEEWKAMKLKGWTVGVNGELVHPPTRNDNEGRLTAEFLEGAL